MITFRTNEKGAEQNKTETQMIFIRMMKKKLTSQKGTGRKIESKLKINKHPIHNAYETNIVFDGRQKHQNRLNNLA